MAAAPDVLRSGRPNECAGRLREELPDHLLAGDDIQSTVFLIPVRAWSDGSPAPPVVVQHAQMKK
jgi:hypothetical protein